MMRQQESTEKYRAISFPSFSIQHSALSDQPSAVSHQRSALNPPKHILALLLLIIIHNSSFIIPASRQGGHHSWYLQSFRPQNCLDPAFLKIKPYTEKEMKEILQEVQKILPKTRIRGLD
jgi:hypothetical protein